MFKKVLLYSSLVLTLTSALLASSGTQGGEWTEFDARVRRGDLIQRIDERDAQERVTCSFYLRWNDIEDLSTPVAQAWLAKEGMWDKYPHVKYVPLLLPLFPLKAQDSIAFTPDYEAVYHNWGALFPVVRAKSPMSTLHPSYSFVRFSEGDGPCPGVVLCHGSDGPVMDTYFPVMELLAQHGFASIMASPDAGYTAYMRELDGRAGAQSYEGGSAAAQLDVPLEQQIIATSRIAEIFTTHPRLKGQRMGIMGWSRGGNVALEMCLERVRAYLQPKVDMSACALFYPFPIQHRREVTRVPTHVLFGEADDYTPLKPVETYFKRVEGDITWSTFPGVGHAFDMQTGDEAVCLPDVQNFSNAWVRFSKDGQTFQDPDGRVYLRSAYAGYLMSRITLGATLSGSQDAREKAAATVVSFFTKHLMTP